MLLTIAVQLIGSLALANTLIAAWNWLSFSDLAFFALAFATAGFGVFFVVVFLVAICRSLSSWSFRSASLPSRCQ